ncbi:MAG: hypothetical protein JRD71_00030 [Deltaproteobacteria bacterium]|nr:hypothetical protein [Deltaproteobacteria bacterium]
MFFDDDHKNDGSIPPHGLNTVRIINIDGVDIQVSSEVNVVNPDGTISVTGTEYRYLAADGRVVSADVLVAVSWTRTPIPNDRYAICDNPWGLHKQERNIYVGIDGGIVPPNYFLCSECLERWEKRAKWRKLLGPFMYRDEF